MRNVSPEEFEDAVAFSLFNGLPAALAEQAARYADVDVARNIVVPLDAPPWEAYFPGGTSLVTTYPAVEVAAPDMTVANLDIAQRDGDITLSLIVRHWARHAIYEVLHRQMARTSAAIIDVLLRPSAIADCDVQGLRGAWRANPETGTHDEIVSGAVLAFTVTTVLTR